MTSVPEIVKSLEGLPQEDLDAVAAFVQTLAVSKRARLRAVTEGAAAKLVPVLPDPPATGVWKKRSETHTDDW
jgi:hypothetical protein